MKQLKWDFFCFVAIASVFIGISGANALQESDVEILIKAKPHVEEVAIRRIIAAQGARQRQIIEKIGVRVLRVPAGKRQKILKALSHNPQIEFAEPNYIHEPTLTPNDPSYSSQWHLPKISAPTAWNATTGSSDVIVAILDSGINPHPDLVDRLVPGWNFYDGNSDVHDVTGHGTAVAGTAVASSNNALNTAGVVWNSKLMPLRIASTTGGASSSAIADALVWAIDHGARVANISYGNVTKVTTIISAAQYYQSKGGVITVSSGNSALFDSTSDSPLFIVVSATDSTDTVTTWSNTGNNVDISAPGQNITTVAASGGVGVGSGTSFSAPIVAGVAALMFSVNPYLTPTQLQTALFKSADDRGVAGWDPSYGWGRVNAAQAVLEALSTSSIDTSPPTVSITSPSNGTSISGSTAITVSSTDNAGVTKVELYLDNVLINTASTPSLTFSWDSTGLANGLHTITAKAYDAANNVGVSAATSINVQNVALDTTAPLVAITTPTSGAVLGKTVKVSVAASDNVQVTRIELYIDGKFNQSSTTAPTTFSWSTTKASLGTHTLQAFAFDAAGNKGSSLTVAVTK